tara:strand:+ start:316 stop:810 length:495 start_codon:yes stop_codon:yes gene_type:complete
MRALALSYCRFALLGSAHAERLECSSIASGAGRFRPLVEGRFFCPWTLCQVCQPTGLPNRSRNCPGPSRLVERNANATGDSTMANDDVIETKSKSKWFWLAAIVLLAVAAVIVFLNADGDDPAPADNAVTTQQERLDTDLDSAVGEDAMAVPTGEEGGEATPAE